MMEKFPFYSVKLAIGLRLKVETSQILNQRNVIYSFSVIYNLRRVAMDFKLFETGFLSTTYYKPKLQQTML